MAMEPLRTTYRVRGEEVTVVTEPLRTRKQTHAEHTKRCKLAVQMLYSNAAPTWLAELEANPLGMLDSTWITRHIVPRDRAKDVERTARGSFPTHVRFLPGFTSMVKTRWADAK